MRPTACDSRPVGGTKSSPGLDILPRLHSAIESGFLYTPPTPNAAIRPTSGSTCVAGHTAGPVVKTFADRTPAPY